MALIDGVLAEVDRTIEGLIGEIAGRAPATRALLDVGCWDGADTERYARRLGGAAFGVEVFDGPASLAEARGIQVARIDLESGTFPWADGSMDVVVTNQVFEHLKNVWRPMSEIYRVLREGGWLILSVPNLASLHNRVLLGLGQQPTSIRTMGPHVRGYTMKDVRNFVALGDVLRVHRSLGVGFYPFPIPFANPFARLWPGAGHTTVILARKVQTVNPAPWEAWLRKEYSHLQGLFGDPGGP